MYQLDVDSLNIDYKYYSGDGVMCLCEFHNDTNPSMFVNLVDCFYYCFACGAKGTTKNLIVKTGGTEKFIPYVKKHNEDSNNEWRKLLSYPLAVNDPYLLDRGFTKEFIELYDLRSNDEFVIIPVNKDCIKVRLKNNKSNVKYLTFGEQPRYYNNYDAGVLGGKEDVYVTEGMFGLIKYHQLGYNAVTPLSVSRFEGLVSFFSVFNDNYYIAFDPDIMGYLNGAKLLYKTFHLENVRGILHPYDIDLVNGGFLDSGTTKQPEIYLGHIKKFGDDKMIDSINKYKKYIKGKK